MPWYKTGTATVTLSSATVTGAGTAWVDNTRIGDAFIGPDGLVYEITARASDTSLTIAPPYKSATGSARPYVIAPMQGYVKTLADQAQLLINSTEPIVPAGTTAQYYRGDKTWQAMASMPVSAATTAAIATKADATATTAAIATKADATATTAAIAARYGKNNILGTVSQSAGVPTGAVIERGSNANGEYVRWADGTQICTRNGGILSFGNSSNLVCSWTYPAGFAAPPAISTNLEGVTLPTTKTISAFTAWSRTTTFANVSVLAPAIFVAGDVSGQYVDNTAVGRWF